MIYHIFYSAFANVVAVADLLAHHVVFSDAESACLSDQRIKEYIFRFSDWMDLYKHHCLLCQLLELSNVKLLVIWAVATLSGAS